MKTTFNYLIIFLILFSCSANNKKNDLQRENLKGNVKSVKEVSYEAVDKFGKITKGKKDWAWYDSKSNSNIKFDKKGNLIEYSDFSSEGELYSKHISTYDDNGKFIEEIKYDKDGKKVFITKIKEVENGNAREYKRYDLEGNLILKGISKYDDNHNLIESSRYKADGSLDSKIIYKYDENDNKIEYSMYKSDGTLIYQDKSKFDKNGNEVEVNYYGSEGELMAKANYQYTFDDKNNWITRTLIEDDIPKYIVEREIEYY